MIIIRSSQFKKSYKKLEKNTKIKVDERLRIFVVNEFDPLLNNHKLTGDWTGYRSINITGDIRLIIRKSEDGAYILSDIGTHHQLFGK